MPFYDYTCSDCGHTWEEHHGMNEKKDTCPKCGGRAQKHIGTIGYRRDHTVNG